jgi:DNA-binding NarL/FixJ family response regulator
MSKIKANADDHAMLRDGCALLSQQKDIEIIGEAAEGKGSASEN